MATLLIPRPQPAAEKTARALEAMGHTAIISPLLEIVATDDAIPGAPEQYAAIAVSSASAVLGLVNRKTLTKLAHLPVFAVGHATAQQALDAGFSDVTSADGKGDDLTNLILSRFQAGQGSLLYCAGRDRAFNLEARLHEYGIHTDVWEVYESRLVDGLDDAAQTILDAGNLDGVLLYSPRMAGQLAKLLKEHKRLNTLRFFAISDAVKAALPLAMQHNTVVAESPNEAALFALIRAV